ncbi:MAG TPA: M20/M25/M40 family metallo-hydrolase [Bryobacteraceae bacterium]|nr:M20/M25/M40 family metallo-hydrolase [Bryobacteraceae bacterium]
MRKTVRFLAILLPVALFAQERVDLSVINRIKQEAFQNSKVMDYVFYLSDVSGPRIAGSPEYRKAAEWSVKTLKEIGLEDAKMEKWGSFGRSWSYSKGTVNMIEPVKMSLIALPLAWAPGTNGPVTGEAMLVQVSSVEDAVKLKGQLKGKWILYQPARELALPLEPFAKRYTDAELAAQEQAPEPGAAGFGRGGPRQPGQPNPMQQYMTQRQIQRKLMEVVKEDGALGVITPSSRGEGGTLFHGPAGSRTDTENPPVNVALVSEQYNRLVRLLEKKITVKLEVDVAAEMHEKQDGFNVIANLPGGKKKDEVIIIGGHLDSWHGGTGATDNAIGCAVMMEAARILKALDLKLDRTVRVALWDAEEVGLIGSREYVKANYADPTKMELKKDHGKVSGYFNIDNGAGKIRGVYLQGNDMMRPVFESWFAPFKDLGVNTVTIRNTSGTDHLAFDAVGIPGFQFIQDPLDYFARTHHSNMDVVERVPKADAMQMSAIVASIVYQAATRPEMLPRKALPKPGSSGSFEAPAAKPEAPKPAAAAK